MPGKAPQRRRSGRQGFLFIHMHLRQVKISGFKSFADPTVIEFPSGFVGIVGPNGCGKSNVIDAVRWVMGEGRAGELRATSSMTELIFAGSAGRAPAGRASVEMVLDNSDGTLSGPWGAYSEVSIRRTLTRDAASAYFINGQAVRRRDVQDIFMGTGLGPRSYAIISQGMVSSFVKARPEELRVYFEEAAGVSRYKERRREAEGRLSLTRTNLERVSDLQQVRRADIERLSAEAQTAQKWRSLTQRRERFAGMWLVLQERGIRDARDRTAADIAEAMAEIESGRTAMASLEKQAAQAQAGLEEARSQEALKREALKANELELARRQSALAALVEKKKMLEERVRSDGEKLERASRGASDSSAKAQGFEEESRRLTSGIAECEAEKEERAQALEEERDAFEQAKARERALAQSEKEAQSRLTELNFTQQALGREKAMLEDRLGRLGQEKSDSAAPKESELEQAREYAEECSASLEECEQRSEQAREELTAAEEDCRGRLEQKNRSSEALARLQARSSALREVQQKALAEGRLPDWIRSHGLEGLPTLVSGIRVEEGWERAVEAALSARMTSLEAGSLARAVSLAADPPPARFALVDVRQGEALRQSLDEQGSLAQKVLSVRPQSAALVRAWLARFRIAPSLGEALRLSQSEPQASFITKEGHTVSAGCVLFWASESPASGFLEHAGELSRLEQQRDSESKAYQALLEGVVQAESRREAALARSRDAAAALESSRREQQAAALRLSEMQASFEAWSRRASSIEAESSRARERLEEIEAQSESSEAQFEELDQALSKVSQEHQDAEMAAEAAQSRLQGEEGALRDCETRLKLLQTDARHAAERARDARTAALRAQSEEAEFTAAIEESRALLEELDETAGSEGVREQLQAHDAAEASLREAERIASEAAEKVAGLDAERSRLSLAERPKLERVGEMKVRQGSLENELSALTTQIEQRRADRAELLAAAQEGGWTPAAARREATKLEHEIEQLGPVNHAALENLEAARRALSETDAQAADLQSAVETLEGAIRKIDAETRGVLKSTFDAVNSNFSDIFRRIFSGGEASLEMVGEEVLECGIEIRAQPPGKRNASVKLLSGGEQALTATALIFAMFRLNPAPFCLLDEVDAPLDEANQARLAKLVESMSEATQFVAITHHRITMEYARQLIGVTMREPGVSRVVSVDISEAVRYSSQPLPV